MKTPTENNKRIAKNTLLLYFRMILLIFVQLYTVPIVLKNLGIEDYGIYNVVGGIVTMFSFIGGSLASGSQRFLAFEIGRGDSKRLKEVFDTTLSIYLILAIITVLLLEMGGYWFLNTQMNIPVERMNAANWVFQLSILSFFINLISIPYNAAVIAHEKMSLFAYVSILECILKLTAAILLQYVLFDKLIIYAVFISSIAIIIRLIYQVYCKKHFTECKYYHFIRKNNMGKELLIYSGWNMIGSVALISRQQGLNVVINLFFGPLLNAAHSIAQQINGVLAQFINNVYTATRPQITKHYASGETIEMWNLVFRSSKLAFYLLTFISIPALLELDMILSVWLHEVPPYTVPIARLMIISILIETMANQIIGAYQAANKIKRYQLYSSTVILLNIPISYIVLKINPFIPVVPYIISTLLSVLYTISILWNAKKEIGLNLNKYLKDVLLKNIIVYSVSIGVIGGCICMIPSSFFRIIITICLTIVCCSIIVWTAGLDLSEKHFIKKIIQQKILKK